MNKKKPWVDIDCKIFVETLKGAEILEGKGGNDKRVNF